MWVGTALYWGCNVQGAHGKQGDPEWNISGKWGEVEMEEEERRNMESF